MSQKKRVLLVAADGADPRIAARLMREGKLPNLSQLCTGGKWGPLQTTFPPVSPVAWTTCLTGVPPAQHGIHDFITKAPGSYLPTIGLFDVRGGSDGIPIYTSRRAAPTLAERLSTAGHTSYLLKVPGTFPPPPAGNVLAGFGMPDLLGTFGVSAWYTTHPAEKRAAAPEGQEWVHPLTPLDGNTWQGEIAGPAQTRQTFALHRTGDQATITLSGSDGPSSAVLHSGEWSGWVHLTFAVPGRGSVPGICRFKLVSLGRQIELYRSAVQCTPDAPLFPLCQPPGFGARLQDRIGPFATLGMPADLDGVRRGVVDHDTFLQDAFASWNQQVDMTLQLMDDPGWDLIVTHLFTIDNVQHLFWHCQDPAHPAYTPRWAAQFGDQIERAYRWLDDQLGKLLCRLGENTIMMVVSDHGGMPIYRLAYLNAWLRAQGLLVPREADPAQPAAIRIDWNRTRAAMFGTGSIWLNVQGRDPRGTVPPGAPYEALRHEIAQALLDWRDPQDGQQVVKRVLFGEDVFGPATRQRGPDLVPALNIGYGLGRGEGLGRVMSGTPLIEPNTSAWTGGHEGPYLPADVPGICVLWGPDIPAGQTLQGADMADIAPTVLALLDIPSFEADRHLL